MSTSVREDADAMFAIIQCFARGRKVSLLSDEQPALSAARLQRLTANDQGCRGYR